MRRRRQAGSEVKTMHRGVADDECDGGGVV